MTTPGWVEDYPHAFRDIDDEREVQVFQHRAGETSHLVEWSGGSQVIVNGGPAVLLPDGGVVGLGDFAVRDGEQVVAEQAGGFFNRFTPS